MKNHNNSLVSPTAEGLTDCLHQTGTKGERMLREEEEGN